LQNVCVFSAKYFKKNQLSWPMAVGLMAAACRRAAPATAVGHGIAPTVVGYDGWTCYRRGPRRLVVKSDKFLNGHIIL
jgi:hypothetical protein